MHPGGDLPRVEPVEHQGDEFPLAGGEAMRAGNQREYVLGTGPADADRDRVGHAVHTGGLDDRPASVTGADPHARRASRIIAGLSGQESSDDGVDVRRQRRVVCLLASLQEREPLPRRLREPLRLEVVVDQQHAGLPRVDAPLGRGADWPAADGEPGSAQRRA